MAVSVGLPVGQAVVELTMEEVEEAEDTDDVEEAEMDELDTASSRTMRNHGVVLYCQSFRSSGLPNVRSTRPRIMYSPSGIFVPLVKAPCG